jgi:hypothetical protein
MTLIQKRPRKVKRDAGNQLLRAKLSLYKSIDGEPDGVAFYRWLAKHHEADLGTLSDRLLAEKSADGHISFTNKWRSTIREYFPKFPDFANNHPVVLPPPHDSKITYYKILNVSEVADQAIIRAAYQQLALNKHPDRHVRPGANEIAEHDFKLINSAYSILSDPEKRFKYDQKLHLAAEA